MLSVKMLKPYYIKDDERFVRVVLAYQYFSLYVDGEIYHFVPLEAKEIIIDRKKKKVHNVFDIFVFQRGKKVIYVAVTDLLQLPDFLTHLNSIVAPYFHENTQRASSEYSHKELEALVKELERNNFYRMVDKALDARDEGSFRELLAEWNFA